MRRPDGCSTTAERPAHDLEVYLSVHNEDGDQPFCPGQRLHAGDSLQVNVELDRSAHVQLVFVDPEGHAGEIEPQSGDSATKSAVFKTPPGLLTHRVGEAQLFIVASESILKVADPTMHLLFEAIRDTGVVVDREGHVRQHGAPGTDTLHFDTQADLHADFNDQGVAMLGLSLRAGN